MNPNFAFLLYSSYNFLKISMVDAVLPTPGTPEISILFGTYIVLSS